MAKRPERQSNTTTPTQHKPFPWGLAVLAVVLVVAAGFALRLCSTAATIDVTVNGKEYTLHGAKTVQTAIKESGIPVNPGDLISLRGQVLEKHAGNPFYATVNGVETVDADLKLRNGDQITLADGHDIVEDYTSEYEPIAYEAVTRGMGPLHVFEAGADGTMEIRTGTLSGETVRKLKEDTTDLVRECYSPDTGDDKVIALTFDDGPSVACTEAILDVLLENDAKATFFIVGARIIGEDEAALVRRAHQAGHQLCTHTYSFEQSNSMFDYSTLSAATQVDEIVRGYAAIAEATGVEPSHCVRLPGGMMNNDAVLNVASSIDAEIGWTLDSGDWMLSDEEAIYNALMSAESGDVVLLHDTSNCMQTAAALARALPDLAEKGYRFITIDEMLSYPAQQPNS